jgi:hypothetical protein
MRSLPFRTFALIAAPTLLLMAGCGGGRVIANPSNATFYISPGTGLIDTNCTGCNAINARGATVEKLNATLTTGGAANVAWSVSGGDANSGPGAITSTGEYTPPSYLTADRVDVVVTATLNSLTRASTKATAVFTVTPGFLQPLTPENLALGADGQVAITGFLAEAGGDEGIAFALANSAMGSSGGQGSLGPVNCQRSAQVFTSCSVTYSAPSLVSSFAATYIVATAGYSSSRIASEVLLNSAGVSSNPTVHQSQSAIPALLGSSGGMNNDYDSRGNHVADCCGGTLGSLIQDTSNHQYLLSNNHVLARSDHAGQGDAIVQPGLIDNNCVPNGDGPGTTPVASLTGWLPLSSSATNADAAIAQVESGTVNTSGSILELGARQADGTLAAAPPGTSSSGGRGEAASLDLMVAKSGRTTGLTCAGVSAFSLDVTVDYYLDCAETKPYLTKTFTNQLAISGNAFTDAGDSGSLVVDITNAEPVGLYFTGGTDASGVSQGVASPAPEVLAELDSQVGAQARGGTNYTFVGAADHPVTCLNYGDNTIAAAQARTLSDEEIARTQQALGQARQLINSSSGFLGVAAGKSSDHPGEGAVVLYVDENMAVSAPATVEGVRTLVIPSNAHAVVFGSAPQIPQESRSASGASALASAVLNQALAIKQQVAHNMMKNNSAFFAVGVGQSLDNPKEAALVIYVDRKHVPADLPQIVNGLRTRYIVMDRMHVTRSYLSPIQSRSHCVSHSAPLSLSWPRSLGLN